MIPREHARNLLEIDPEDLTAAIARRAAAGRRVTERLGADGVNLINSCGSAAGRPSFTSTCT